MPLAANANGPENDMPTPDQALKAVHELDLPAGVKLTNITEPIQMTPTDKEGGHHEISTITNDKQEQFLGGLGGGLGLGIGGGLGGLGLGRGFFIFPHTNTLDLHTKESVRFLQFVLPLILSMHHYRLPRVGIMFQTCSKLNCAD
jgi:hypothetical protein